MNTSLKLFASVSLPLIQVQHYLQVLLLTFSTKWGVVISVDISPGKAIVILISGLSSTLSVSKNLTKAALLSYNGNQVKSIVS